MLKSLKITAATVLASLAIGSSASAQGLFETTPADGNLYVSGFVGVGFPSDANYEGVQTPAVGVPGTIGGPANIDAQFDDDVYFGGAVGARLPFKFFNVLQPRIELEVSHLDTEVEGGAFNGGNQTFSGDQSALFIYGNSLTEIVWKDNQKIIPYIGGGLGLAVVDTNIQYFPNNGVANAPTFAVVGETTNFATVSTIGLTSKISDKIELYTEGRYQKIFGVDNERRFIAGGNDLLSANVDDNLDGFSLTVGSRFTF